MKRKFFNDGGHAHYLTFSCYRRQQLLTDDPTRTLLCTFIDAARRKHDFRLWSWVFMPEHVHLIIHPKTEDYSVSGIVRSIKGPFARKTIATWRVNTPHKLARLRLVTKGCVSYRFWQAGGGFDRNLYSWDRVRKAVAYIEHNPVRRGLVSEVGEWEWSSAGQASALLTPDEIEIDGRWRSKGA